MSLPSNKPLRLTRSVRTSEKGSCFQSTLLPPCLFSQESPSAPSVPSVPSEPLWSGERLGNHRALGNQGGSCGPQVILCRKSALHLVNWELRVVWEREYMLQIFLLSFSHWISSKWPTPNISRQATLFVQPSVGH